MLGREVRLPAELMSEASVQEELTWYGDYVDRLREKLQRARKKHMDICSNPDGPI